MDISDQWLLSKHSGRESQSEPKRRAANMESERTLCDRCHEKDGYFEIEDGWYCVDCYSAWADHVYEEVKDRQGV